MKKIEYQAAGSTIISGKNGKLEKQSISVTVELPYSAENLQKAEAEAFPGTLSIKEEPVAAPSAAQDSMVLVDRATGKPFTVYVSGGALVMEDA